MRATCPACAATYDVPDARIGAGRRLRCARCQHDWFVAPPAATSSAPVRAAENSPFARAMERAAAAPEQPSPEPPAPARAESPPRPTPTAAAPAVSTMRDAATPDEARRAPPGAADPGRDAATASADPAAVPATGRTDPSGASRAGLPPPSAVPGGPTLASRRAAGYVPDRSGTLMVAWVVSLMLFLGFAASLVLYRIEIMEAWPPAERLYVALGMLDR